jgi:large subunit ribosomal protein L24
MRVFVPALALAVLLAGQSLAQAHQQIVVEGVQMIKRHTRANPQRNIKGGIVEKESPIQISNVALVCKNCGKHTRVKHQVLADGRHSRTCKKCGSAIE